MHIIWKGQTCFQIIAQKAKGEQVSVVIDPLEEASGLKMSSTEADIVIFSGSQDKAGMKAIKGDPFIIETPGEYEIKEVFVLGIPVAYAKEGEMSIFSIETEGIRVGHLGRLKKKELTDAEIEKLGDIDILLVPVGGNDVIEAEEARKIVLQIEPRVVIPMHYRIPGLKAKLSGADEFLKIMGAKDVERMSKFLIKKKDLSKEETKVVVLDP
ncbi:MAG: MBL fold metallo-hydrolase [bacterium]